MVRILILFIAIMWSSIANSAIRYVDTPPTESDATWSGVNGQAYTSTATGFPGTGYGYDTVKNAIAAMSSGDKVYLRGGTYQEGHIELPTSINGTAWTEGNYNYIGSFPGEWAILDGNASIDGSSGYSVIGQFGHDYAGAVLAYWKFERLEITGGGHSSHAYAYGFFGNVGPFWFRYCYIHDNYVRDGGTGSVFANGGLSGYTWQDSIVEYSYLTRNGKLNPAEGSHNVGEINIASDYRYDTIHTAGFDPTNNSGQHRMRNIVRYSRFDSSEGGFAIKDKAGQLFTSRVTYDDTYNTYGNNYNHNYFYQGGIANYGVIDCTTDFTQIYNNIFDEPQGSGVMFGEEDVYSVYKGVAYNNTIYSPANAGISRTWDERDESYTIYYHGYDYNNILDTPRADNWIYSDITVDSVHFEAAEADYSNYVAESNLSYRPTGTTTQQADQFWVGEANYTSSEFEAAFGGVNWVKQYDSGDLLFVGTTGADRFRVDAAHVIDIGVTIAGGGANIAHPYLSGVTIPEYIGAANPDDDDWVAGVMFLDSTDMVSAVAGSDPTWIEGAVITPIDGECVIGLTTATTPTTATGCISGTLYSLVGTGPWTYGCDGVNGGTPTATSACSAAYEAAPTTGTITAYSLSDGSVIPYKLTTE